MEFPSKATIPAEREGIKGHVLEQRREASLQTDPKRNVRTDWNANNGDAQLSSSSIVEKQTVDVENAPYCDGKSDESQDGHVGWCIDIREPDLFASGRVSTLLPLTVGNVPISSSNRTLLFTTKYSVSFGALLALNYREDYLLQGAPGEYRDVPRSYFMHQIPETYGHPFRIQRLGCACCCAHAGRQDCISLH